LCTVFALVFFHLTPAPDIYPLSLPAALPISLGAPVMNARMRSTPEDFLVEELPGFAPSGSGEHLLLTIEKRGMNTAFAAKRIAQDRKSTRLNSSHVKNSYAVFCLKKKTT